MAHCQTHCHVHLRAAALSLLGVFVQLMAHPAPAQTSPTGPAKPKPPVKKPTVTGPHSTFDSRSGSKIIKLR